MDDEINKTSHENITHLAANTLYFLQKKYIPDDKRMWLHQAPSAPVSHNSHHRQSPSACDALNCIVWCCSRWCVSLLLIIKTMKLFDYHIQNNVQRNGNFTASLSVPQF